LLYNNTNTLLAPMHQSLAAAAAAAAAAGAGGGLFHQGLA
jgi:hypothetical protein